MTTIDEIVVLLKKHKRKLAPTGKIVSYQKIHKALIILYRMKDALSETNEEHSFMMAKAMKDLHKVRPHLFIDDENDLDTFLEWREKIPRPSFQILKIISSLEL